MQSMRRLRAAATGIVAMFVSADPYAQESAASAAAQSSGGAPALAVTGSKDYEDMSQAERDAAKQAARRHPPATLRVCADPGNMPFSDNRERGFENRIAQVLADAMHAKLVYAWRPTFERGLTRQPMNDLNICDVMVGVPSDYEVLLTTMPLYRSTYVLAWRTDRGYDVRSLDDPVLKRASVGVYETSGVRNALANHGVKNNVFVQETSHDADLVPEHQPWHQVEQVARGELDIAAVWGPFAGWVMTQQHAPIAIRPTNLMDDVVPMEFSVAIGVRKYDAVMKYALEDAMEARRAEIAAILAEFGVPLVQCSECLVSGDLPAHGDYNVALTNDGGDPPILRAAVPNADTERRLAEGADLDEELENAALAADLGRVKFLLTKGARPDRLGKDGESPMHHAVTNGDPEMIAALLDGHATIDFRDRDGYTPLALAAVRNKPSVIRLLAKRGADVEARIPTGYTPLFIAIGEGKLAAAKALMDVGARCNVAGGRRKLTPLMAAATQKVPEKRILQLAQMVSPIEVAQELLKRGADANAVNADGVTALMIAAARDNAPMIGVLVQSGARADAKSATGQTALDIARENGNDAAARMLQLAPIPSQ
ncbi:MAG TPA: quinoprotein dehydrogenase-associated putative ABC transporter substrate-binding protein [Burkholderiaceae bacterium]|nr:quinoprotein dehydrogenase-associated putative ABC transporter substrate-binding protein [Burkholderiaceae bacterium]